MVGRTKKPTADEKRRMETIKNHIPCLPCIIVSDGRYVRYPEVQHVVEGFKRLGHEFTHPLCGWHHRGIILDNWTTQAMLGAYGPSLSQGKKTFAVRFGSERNLVKLTDWLLEQFERKPWDYYNIPYDIRREAIRKWEGLNA